MIKSEKDLTPAEIPAPIRPKRPTHVAHIDTSIRKRKSEKNRVKLPTSFLEPDVTVSKNELYHISKKNKRDYC